MYDSRDRISILAWIYEHLHSSFFDSVFENHNYYEKSNYAKMNVMCIVRFPLNRMERVHLFCTQTAVKEMGSSHPSIPRTFGKPETFFSSYIQRKWNITRDHLLVKQGKWISWRAKSRTWDLLNENERWPWEGKVYCAEILEARKKRKDTFHWMVERRTWSNEERWFGRRREMKEQMRNGRHFQEVQLKGKKEPGIILFIRSWFPFFHFLALRVRKNL